MTAVAAIIDIVTLTAILVNLGCIFWFTRASKAVTSVMEDRIALLKQRVTDLELAVRLGRGV